MAELINYNPDVLSCLANLSNDEVFTPPEIANKIIDLLPQNLFENKNTTFLDPGCKSGIFLREIGRRLMKGLEKKIPNIQERIDHIYTKQIYALPITELTSLLSRRSIYCSTKANGKYSITQGFDNEQGNIIFEKKNHTWINGSCSFCGANENMNSRDESLESHAYQFIHTNKPEEIFNMKFDVIIGNPPFQLNIGNTSGNSSKAKAIYHKFIDQAIALNPRYISMITPSRWMTKSADGVPDQWVEKLIKSNKIKILHDYINSKDMFPGVMIEGGVNFFLWENDYNGKCEYSFHESSSKKTIPSSIYLDKRNIGIVVRDNNAQEILDKIEKKEGNYYCDAQKNFSGLVSPKDFFTNKTYLTSSWKNYKDKKTGENQIKYYLNKAMHKRDYGWIKKSDVPKNILTSQSHKVLIPAAHGGHQKIIGNPFYSEPGSVCSQTYLVIGYDFKKHNFNKNECQNIISYISTKFFRYLVSIKKKTQNGPRGVYQFVPLQNFKESWTDEKLYKKYNISDDEINLINLMIK